MPRLYSLNTISHEKEPGLLGKMDEFLSEAGMSLEYLVILENKEAIKVHWGHVKKSTGTSLKELPMVKTETICRGSQ